MASDYSVVDWHSGHEGHRCGYCKSPDNNYSQGMTAYHLTVDDYQDLIDRGWRRSGTYLYKPTMNKTCCPPYTIRCDAPAFNLSRSHKKAIKRVNKYLNFGTIPGKDEHEDDVRHPSASEYPQTSDTCADNTTAVQKPLINNADPVKFHQPKPGTGEDPTKPKCMKAKLRRLEKKKLKIEAVAAATTDAVQSDCSNKTKVTEKKTLEDHLGDIIEMPVHKLEIQLVQSFPGSKEFKDAFNESYGIFKKYQTVIHREDESECSKFMFEGFLVESPLQSKDGLPHGFGSFHQLYILDGKIIAVGVLDVLPKCVSSVYLYYDPDYSFLSLGTYSALRELAFTRELHRIYPGISYYYMGFYIHSCPKMRYKGQYDPSYLLCPEVFSWHEMDECRMKLDNQSYSRFAVLGVEDKDSSVEVNDVLVLHQRQPMPYGFYRSKKPKTDDKKSVSIYARLVGMTLAKRILLYRK